jgi:membrane protein
MPRIVSGVLEPVARDVVEMRHGWLLWVGMAAGLWTVSSLIETVRDILRRAYGTPVARKTFWRRRLIGTGLVMVAVIPARLALYAGGDQHDLATDSHRHDCQQAMAANLSLSRLVPMGVLFGALYLYFSS